MQTALEIAEEISNELTQASLTLLKEVPDPKSVMLLMDLGFTSSENISDFEDHRTGHSIAKFYLQKYPNYKFITDYQLDKIKVKYKLIEGALADFKGRIPDKNVYDLMRFTIEAGDIVVKDRPMHMSDAFDSRDRDERRRRGMNGGGSAGAGRGRWINDEYMNVPYDLTDPDYRHRYDHSRDMRPEACRRLQVPSHAKVGFADIVRNMPFTATITAPPELFNTPDKDLDPIVCVAVTGGKLIATAWGPEASDPDVVNFVFN
jgi:hypothetical protein